MFRHVFTGDKRAYGKFAFAAILAISFHGPSRFYRLCEEAQAKYGTIKILSTPGGLPIEIDGRSEGLTSTDYRASIVTRVSTLL